jgi:exopolysaccharide biosynthesis polyprenyl glycosylphosphotransferase
MIKEREPVLERISVTSQVIWTIICYYFILRISGIVTKNNFFETNEYLYIAIIIVFYWFFLLELFEMGSITRMQNYLSVIKQYTIIISFGTFGIFLIVQLFDFQTLNRFFILKFAILNFFVLVFLKIGGRLFFEYIRRKGYNTRMILIIADDTSISLIKRIIESDKWGYKIWGIISDSERVKQEFGHLCIIYPECENFSKIIDEKIIDEVFYCKQDFNTKRIRRLIDECQEIGVSFHLHNKALVFGGLIPKISFLNKQLFLTFRNTPENYLALQIKKTFDFFISLIVLILIFPIILIIVLLIKFEDGGPVLFKQLRVGRHGRLFKCLKFRTMVVNAEDLKYKMMLCNEQTGPVFKMKNDPRITRIGRLLRKTSLDELPQFINVLLGDMSIVGPRPPIPSEVKQYARNIKRRLSINPGITCIWQVSGRNSIPFDKWVEMDMEYIDNWSLKLDLIIILKTIKVIFKRNGL